MSDIVERLQIYASDDHERLCQGREYTCSCGYDDKRDPLLTEAADEITRLRAEVERLARDYNTARDAHDSLVIENEKLRDEVRVWIAHTKTAVWSDTEECKFLNEEVTRLVKSRNRWAQKYNDLLNKKRAEDGHDVYAAAREEYRKKIKEQAAEVEKLKAALEAWDQSVQADITMEGPVFITVSRNLGRKAWDMTRAALGDTHD